MFHLSKEDFRAFKMPTQHKRKRARLLDGAAVVYLLPTVNVAMFDEYADKIFLPHISKQLECCT